MLMEVGRLMKFCGWELKLRWRAEKLRDFESVVAQRRRVETTPFDKVEL